MNALQKHFTRCLIAGFVALLPIVGAVVAVVYVESLIADSWLRQQGFYFFGMGLLVVVLLAYVVGLIVSSVIGGWLWRFLDRTMDQLPVLGNLYQTIKQILGYGEGPNALFRRAVLVATNSDQVLELGLLTREASPQTGGKATVFLPGAPTPTSGRLLMVDEVRLRPCELSVGQTMQLLVSLGAMEVASKSGTTAASS